MPKRKITKRPIRRRRRVLRRRYRKPVVAKGPFPVTKIAKMRLVIPQQTFTCTLGALAKLNIQANRPYSGTNYAYGWNQWAALYNNYIVLGSKCRMFIQGFSAASTIMGMAGIYLSDDTTNFTSWVNMIEARRGTNKSFRQDGDKKVTMVMSKYSAKKHYNIKDIKDNVERLGSTMTAGPTDAAYFNCWMQPIDQTNGATYYATFIVDYIVMFSEPKDVAAS